MRKLKQNLCCVAWTGVCASETVYRGLRLSQFLGLCLERACGQLRSLSETGVELTGLSYISRPGSLMYCLYVSCVSGSGAGRRRRPLGDDTTGTSVSSVITAVVEEAVVDIFL